MRGSTATRHAPLAIHFFVFDAVQPRNDFPSADDAVSAHCDRFHRSARPLAVARAPCRTTRLQRDRVATPSMASATRPTPLRCTATTGTATRPRRPSLAAGCLFLSDYSTSSCGISHNVRRVSIRRRGDSASCAVATVGGCQLGLRPTARCFRSRGSIHAITQDIA